MIQAGGVATALQENRPFIDSESDDYPLRYVTVSPLISTQLEWQITVR